MSTTTAPVLITGAASALVVGVVTGEGWPGFVVGAVLAVALWAMLFLGSAARADGLRPVSARDYLLASVLGLLIGGAMFLASDDNAAFWAPGFIVGGVLLPVVPPAVRRGEQS